MERWEMNFNKWWQENQVERYEGRTIGRSAIYASALAAWKEATAQSSALVVNDTDTMWLLKALSLKGGAAGALGEAGLLFEKKGQDYNTGFKRDDYFPMGVGSYAQMLWVKALRLLSFAKAPRPPSNESMRDTALDLINYAAFFADWLHRTQPVALGSEASFKKEARAQPDQPAPAVITNVDFTDRKQVDVFLDALTDSARKAFYDAALNYERRD